MTDLSPLATIAFTVLIHDTLRYAVGAGGVYLIVNRLLRHRLAHRKIRPETPKAAQLRREILVSLRTILVFAATGITIASAHRTGLVPIYGAISDYGLPWFLASIALIILAHDAWFYWSHRAMHRGRLFRPIHRLHHRSHTPSPFTSYSFDTGEAVVNAAFLPLFVTFVPMHPTAILVFVLHMMLRNAIAHCGVELLPARGDGRPLFGWLATVTHHDLHHAHAGYNLGFYFTWWDRWMGTEHPDYLATFARSVTRLRPLSAAVLALPLLLPADPGAAGDNLAGVYASPGLSMVVQFEPCASAQDAVCGRLIWAWDKSELHHAGLGDTVISGLRPENGGWTGGRLTDPETGRVYRGSVQTMMSGDLYLKGCAGPVCSLQVWRNITSVRQALASLP